MDDEELQRRVQFLERKLAAMEDEAAIQRRKDAYTMATLGKRNLQNNVTMDLMFAGNLVWNSSFEMPSAGVLPTYWTGGVSSTEQAFIGTVSLKLTAGQSCEQAASAYIPVPAFGEEQVRVTFAQLGGKMRCEVLDHSGISMLSDDFNPTDFWYNGRRTITVKPGTATSVHLRFTNIDTTNPVYIDAVQVEPDVLRKWPSLYTDGPKSGAYASEAAAGGGGSGGMPTVLVAASTASSKIKALADYVCDGTADDVEINAAITAAAGGRVVLTDGRFYITTPVSPAAPIAVPMLMGMGPATSLYAQVPMPAVVGGTNTAAIIVRDLTIDGNLMAVIGLDCSLYNDNFLIENVDVSNCTGDGMRVGQILGSTIATAVVNQCRSYNNGGVGFVLGDVVHVNNCRADTNATNGFELSAYGHAHECIAMGNTGSGFYVPAVASWLEIEGCIAEGNRNGIKVDNAIQSVVKGNLVRGNREHGIHLSGANRCTVVGNQVLQSGVSLTNTYANIQLDGSTKSCSINDNMCSRTASAGANFPKYGINIATGATGTRNWVANNNCLDGGVTAGIADTGTGTIRDPGNILNNGTWSNLTG